MLIAGGFALLLVAQTPGPVALQGRQTFTIPDGLGWHSSIELDMLEGGTIDLDFEALSGGTVVVFLLTEEGYDLYEATGLAGAVLKQSTGSSGVLAVAVPAEGVYYVVFAHGVGFELLPQEVDLAYQLEGLRPLGPNRDLARGGFALILVGAVLGNAAGFLVLRRAARAQDDPLHRFPGETG